jgi:RNA polymerase sigma factor (sigma-70 family)
MMDMATSRLSKAVHELCRATLKGGAGLSDRQLLDHFIEHRDEAAFAALVRRHGALVWGVCRRILAHHHDAEDAFQAAFLVLARKAASVKPRAMVANWLYGVAHRTALKAKAMAMRRRRREKQVLTMPEAKAAAQDRWSELEPLLDQALAALPDKYRVAIILCDLESKTGKEAARLLKVPEGTLATRLRTARALLAKRLGRLGFTAPGSALAMTLSENAATATAPVAVVCSTVKAAPLYAAGQAAALATISPQVAALMEGVLKMMLASKWKLLIGVLLVAGVAVTTGSVFSWRNAAAAQTSDERPTKAASKPVPPGKADRPVRGEPAKDILKDLELEAPTAAPPMLPHPERYEFRFDVLEVNKGREERISSLGLMTQEGQRGVCNVGKAVTTKRGGEAIKLAGFACSARVDKLNDGRLRLDVQVERLEQKDSGAPEVRVQGTSLRVIKIVRLGEKMNLELDARDSSGPRTRFDITIRAGNTVLEGPGSGTTILNHDRIDR